MLLLQRETPFRQRGRREMGTRKGKERRRDREGAGEKRGNSTGKREARYICETKRYTVFAFSLTLKPSCSRPWLWGWEGCVRVCV